jgi:hypothetical protein
LPSRSWQAKAGASGIFDQHRPTESGRLSILHSPLQTLHLKWPPRLISRQRLLLFREALICLSYSGNDGLSAVARRAEADRPAR